MRFWTCKVAWRLARGFEARCADLIHSDEMVQSSIDTSRVEKVLKSYWYLEHGLLARINAERKTSFSRYFHHESNIKSAHVDRLTKLTINKKFEANFRLRSLQNDGKIQENQPQRNDSERQWYLFGPHRKNAWV